MAKVEMWFVSYIKEKRGADQEYYFMNRVVDEHPLEWEYNSNLYDDLFAVTVLCWKELTEDEAAIHLKLVQKKRY